jgi:predicted DNA-binding transcriptional regulator YafY
MLLQARGRTSAQALAEELGVSMRTVYRDIDQLSAAGVPVTVARGAAGGFELLDGWRTRLTGLTASEAQAVFMSGLRGPAAQLGLGEVMRSAQVKLLAALPASWQADADRVGARFHLDPVGWYQRASPVSHLSAVAQAVWQERRIAVHYESWQGVVDRELEPLGLVLKAGEWYLVARVGRDARTYRLSNILSLAVRDETFARPKRFDLEQYWTQSIERFEAGLYRGTARLRVTPLGLKRLRQLSAAVAEAADRAAKKADARGRVCVTIPIESIEHAAVELLRLGAEGEVLEPMALRKRIGDVARAMARQHANKVRRPASAV